MGILCDEERVHQVVLFLGSFNLRTECSCRANRPKTKFYKALTPFLRAKIVVLPLNKFISKPDFAFFFVHFKNEYSKFRRKTSHPTSKHP